MLRYIFFKPENKRARGSPDGIHLLSNEEVGGGTKGDRFEVGQFFWGALQLQHCHVLVRVASYHLQISVFIYVKSRLLP